MYLCNILKYLLHKHGINRYKEIIDGQLVQAKISRQKCEKGHIENKKR